MGFSTGEWVGNTLKVTTTHLKEGWLRRNGVARSDAATVTEHFIRHGNHLTWSVFVQDPKYLEEPFFRNRDYTLAETGSIGAYPCESVVEVVLPEQATSRTTCPGDNPFLIEYARNHKIPSEAAHGRCGDDVSRVPQEDGRRCRSRKMEPAMKHCNRAASVAALWSAAVCGASRARSSSRTSTPSRSSALKVRDNIYMLVGAGGNITMQVGDDGILLVDTQYAPLSEKIVAAIRKISPKPIHYIINTHHHGDHTGGNANLRAAGTTVSGGNMAGAIRDSGVGAAIIAHENVLIAFELADGRRRRRRRAVGRPSTFFGEKKELYFNGEGIEIIHVPAAHTDGDSIVFFRRSDVISAGDVFVTTSYPVIDLASGGSYQGIVAALEQLVDIIIPVYGQDGGTLVIPGHGRLSNLGDVLELPRDGHRRPRSHQDMIEAGMTLEQVKAAKPTFDYDPVYGATTGFWTTDRFVEAAYQSLSAPPGGCRRMRQRRRSAAVAVCRGSARRRSAVVPRSRRGPASRRARAAGGADRSHGSMGVDRHRGLALSDGHAAEGRLPRGYNLTPAGEAIADAWDPAKDEAAGNQCKAYGAAGDHARAGPFADLAGRTTQTLEDRDRRGRQTRLLHFGPVADSGRADLARLVARGVVPARRPARPPAGQRQPRR